MFMIFLGDLIQGCQLLRIARCDKPKNYNFDPFPVFNFDLEKKKKEFTFLYLGLHICDAGDFTCLAGEREREHRCVRVDSLADIV